MNLLKNHSLQALNTFNVNANAKYFIEINTDSELIDLAKNGILNTEKYIILGNGSNILFTDDFDGVVIHNKLFTFSSSATDDSQMYISSVKNCEQLSITIASGNDFKRIINEYLILQKNHKINLFGLENLTAIPASIGAAVVQNIGAYGVELKDFFNSCKAVDLRTGNIIKFNKEECKFDYRNSIFKENKHLFITQVTFAFSLSSKPILDYLDLQKLTSEIGENNLTAQMIYDEIVKIRNEKLPDYKKEPNAGSFFKNPIISTSHLEELKKEFPHIKYYIIDNSFVKISAAWLIENAGLKGYKVGDVGISKHHSLIIINYGHATGQEIVSFAENIINKIKEKFNIKLTPEVEFV